MILDLPEIIIKKLPVFSESGNLKFVKKFISPQESIPVKNLIKCCYLLIWPSVPHCDSIEALLIYNGKNFTKWCKEDSLPKKQFLFIPLNLTNRHWKLPFVNLRTKTLHILELLTQHANAD